MRSYPLFVVVYVLVGICYSYNVGIRKLHVYIVGSIYRWHLAPFSHAMPAVFERFGTVLVANRMVQIGNGATSSEGG